MDTKKARIAEADPGPVEAIRREIAALTDASTQRHRLERGTPEYEAALEEEQTLADRVWKLGAALPPLGERQPARAPRLRSPKPAKLPG